MDDITKHETESSDAYLKAERISLRDILDHITGPAISIIFHVVFLALIGTIVIFQPPEKRQEIVVEVKEVDVKELEKMPEPPQNLEEEFLDENVVQLDRPTVSTDSVNVNVQNVSVENVAVDVNIPDVLSVKPNNSALKLSGVYAARLTGAGRQSALKRYGADARNEEAVNKALKWLMDNQNEDGTWGVFPQSRYAFTALAALAFMAHGETPVSQVYGPTVLKAMKALAEWTETMGRYVGPGDTYSHPIVAYAISEAYGITKMPKAKDAMDKAVRVIIDNINKRGSFSYWYDRTPRIWGRNDVTGRLEGTPEPPSDLSFAGWNYQALKAAHSAGCEVPGLEETIELSIQGLRMHHAKEGGFSVGPSGKADIGMTSLGLLCIGMLGEGDSKESRDSLEWLKENNRLGLKTCSWRYNKEIHDEYNKSFTHAIYTWYYQTQALFQASKGQGSLWNNWNRAFSKALIDEQNQDGSWITPAEKYGEGHLDPQKVNAEWSQVPYFKDPKDLRIYATSLCCLSLEVYYRYLPTYKLEAGSKKKPPVHKSNDDELSLQ